MNPTPCTLNQVHAREHAGTGRKPTRPTGAPRREDEIQDVPPVPQVPNLAEPYILDPKP